MSAPCGATRESPGERTCSDWSWWLHRALEKGRQAWELRGLLTKWNINMAPFSSWAGCHGLEHYLSTNTFCTWKPVVGKLFLASHSPSCPCMAPLWKEMAVGHLPGLSHIFTTFCKVFLLSSPSNYSAMAQIGIKYPNSVQFQTLAVFTHKFINLPPSQEANKKTPWKPKQAQELCRNKALRGGRFKQILGEAHAMWYHTFCSKAKHRAEGKCHLLANSFSLQEGACPGLAVWCCSISRAHRDASDVSVRGKLRLWGAGVKTLLPG